MGHHHGRVTSAGQLSLSKPETPKHSDRHAILQYRDNVRVCFNVKYMYKITRLASRTRARTVHAGLHAQTIRSAMASAVVGAPADMPGTPANVPENTPTCWLKETCGKEHLLAFQQTSDLDADTLWNTSHTSFAMPRGSRYCKPGRLLNYELGRDHEWLPVGHTNTMQAAWQVGLWFYYMRGCSDFVWNVGRTMLSRNKCHAAGLLEQRRYPGLSWGAALDRVAHKFTAAMNHSRLLLATRLTKWAGTGFDMSQVADALASCAAGYGLSSVSDQLALAILSNALDYVMAATMRQELVGTSAELDTLQFHNRCVASLSVTTPGCDGNIEIWDVRFLQQPSAAPARPGTRTRPVWEAGNTSGIFGRLVNADGAPHRVRPCNLSATWYYCLACDQSASERSCCCSTNHKHPASCNYGPHLEHHLLRRLDRTNPLTLETVWSLTVGWWWLDIARL